jgi:hypothetical protein
MLNAQSADSASHGLERKYIMRSRYNQETLNGSYRRFQSGKFGFRVTDFLVMLNERSEDSASRGCGRKYIMRSRYQL